MSSARLCVSMRLDRPRPTRCGRYARRAARRPRTLAGRLAVASAVLAVAACGAPADNGVTAVRVTMGSVARTVSATGTLQAITQQNVGFAKGGKLAALTVAVGQRVDAGQVLARLDDFYAQADLREAQAKLAGAQADPDRIKGSNKADAAQDDYRRAKEVLAATKDAAVPVQAAYQAAP